MIIYKITNLINNKSYIGQTKYSFRKRYNHRDDWWNAPSVSRVLKNAVKKYGEDNFKIEIIHDNVESFEQLNELEKYYISFFGTFAPGGYNLTTGGDSNHTVSEESKRKNSEAHKGRVPGNKGKKATKETRERSSRTKRELFKLGKIIPWNKGLKTGRPSEEAIINSANAHKKKVLLFNKDNIFIKEYESLIDTKKDGFNPSQVSLCCKHPERYKTHRNMIFKYK